MTREEVDALIEANRIARERVRVAYDKLAIAYGWVADEAAQPDQPQGQQHEQATDCMQCMPNAAYRRP